MKSKVFLFQTLILALAIADTTILYFAQMNLLYRYFDADIVYLATICYAYLAQGAGLLAYMLLNRRWPTVFRRKSVLIVVLIMFAPIAALTLMIRSGAVLMMLLILTNILIGYVLSCCFTNIAASISAEKIGLCWGSAYALGNLLSWLISLIDSSFITSIKIIPILCIVIGLNLVPIMLSQDYQDGDESTANLSNLSKSSELSKSTGYSDSYGSFKSFEPSDSSAPSASSDLKAYLWISTVIILMTMIYTLGSTDYSMIAEEMTTSSTFYTRCLYAAGLFLAGFIYDKNHRAGAVLAIASIIYPIMATVLLKIEFQINLIYCLSYFFLGFLAVYRSAVFISFGNENRKYLLFSGMGLLISRFVEAVIALVNVKIEQVAYSGFVLSGILFIPLIIVFCMMVMREQQQEQEQNIPVPLSEEEKLTLFAVEFSLTKREEEIVKLLIQGASNGEIAEHLIISESTARFHVSNVLKKTGCKTRNDVIHLFRQR